MSFCFATCVCPSACDTVRALWWRLKIDTQRVQNRPSEGSKSSQNRPGTSRSAPERPKSVPRGSQEGPRAPQERPKSAPRASQERPRAPQERPRAPQEPLKSALRRPKDPSGRHFEASKLEKATFEDDASRDSVETRVRNDFRSIFASCAQARTCEKPTNTIGFLQVFTMSPLLRTGRTARAEKHWKNTKIDPPEHPKSTRDRPNSLFGALVEPFRAAKSIERASSSELGVTWSVEKACRSDWRAPGEATWLDLAANREAPVFQVARYRLQR